jgi:hypothetical protein
VNDAFEDQVAGRLVSVVWRLDSALPAPTAPRSRNSTTPLRPRIAIQYVWPAETGAAVTATALSWPAAGAVIVPLVRSVPGCPALSDH